MDYTEIDEEVVERIMNQFNVKRNDAISIHQEVNRQRELSAHEVWVKVRSAIDRIESMGISEITGYNQTKEWRKRELKSLFSILRSDLNLYVYFGMDKIIKKTKINSGGKQ